MVLACLVNGVIMLVHSVTLGHGIIMVCMLTVLAASCIVLVHVIDAPWHGAMLLLCHQHMVLYCCHGVLTLPFGIIHVCQGNRARQMSMQGLPPLPLQSYSEYKE